MEEFKGNPLQKNETATEKKLKPVTSNVTVKKEGSLAKKFFAQDLKSTGSNIFNETVVPAIKKTLSDIVKRSIDFLLYGTYNSNSTGYTDYRGVTTRTVSSLAPVGTIPQQQNYAKPAVNNIAALNEVSFVNRGDAEEVLLQMQNACNYYGMISVGDFYDSISQTPNFTDYKWGWKNLDKAQVQRLIDGRYKILFPPVIALE